MCRSMKTSIQTYGVTLLLSNHPELRRLKRMYYPSSHGNKVWNSSWLLIDFFNRQKVPKGVRIVEVGCGWGLVGVYCAKRHNALVTAVDIDKDVFPYLHLHAAINQVEISTLKRSFGRLKIQDLRCFDILIGADISFCEKLALSLKRLINRAVRAGVQMVLISDPGLLSS